MKLAIETVALTAQQNDLWERTRIALKYNAPYFIQIFYKLLSVNELMALFTKEIPIAATDGESILLNPDTFFKYDMIERMTILAHEVMHCIFNHCIVMHGYARTGKISYPDGKSIPYIKDLYNWCADLVINDGLLSAKNGGKPVFKAVRDWCHDPNIATHMDSVNDVYRKQYEKAKKEGRIKQVGKASTLNGNPSQSGQKSFDEHLTPGTSQGKSSQKAEGDRNETKWATVVAEAVAISRLQGKMPASMERLFGNMIEPVVNWRDHIRALINRKAGSGGYDWHRADRRLIVRDIYAPSRSGYGAGTIVVGADTSGSIGPKTLDMMLAEIAGILEGVRPRRLIVLWCDADIGPVDEIESVSDLNTRRGKGAGGGGGTSFVPVFDWIKKEGVEPDALVYLTDGFGSFPDKTPPYPTIWGSITPKDQVTYPFGDVVLIPKQAE